MTLEIVLIQASIYCILLFNEKENENTTDSPGITSYNFILFNEWETGTLRRTVRTQPIIEIFTE